MLQKFIISQAINIASLTIAELIKKHHEKFDMEKARTKIHENIRIIIKPNFLFGEKLLEEKAIKAADWFLEKACAAMTSSQDLIRPLFEAVSGKNFQGAIKMLKDFVAKTVGVQDQVGAAGGEADEPLVNQYVKENPGEVDEEDESSPSQKSEGSGGQKQIVVQGSSVTDSMQPPETKSDAQQGQQPVIPGNEEEQKPQQNQEQKSPGEKK